LNVGHGLLTRVVPMRLNSQAGRFICGLTSVMDGRLISGERVNLL
jgi:hypothetical protein